MTKAKRVAIYVRVSTGEQTPIAADIKIVATRIDCLLIAFEVRCGCSRSKTQPEVRRLEALPVSSARERDAEGGRAPRVRYAGRLVL